MSEALIVVAHGSPDPDWRRPLEALTARLQERAPQRPIRLAYLEHAQPDLRTAAQELAAAGVEAAVVVAAFLSPGGRHIKRDLPALVAEVDSAVAGLSLTLAPGALGEHPAVIEAMATAALQVAAGASLTSRP